MHMQHLIFSKFMITSCCEQTYAELQFKKRLTHSSICRFQEELAQISRQIKQRNKSKGYPYDWLDPEFIPNAISI